MLAFMEIFIKIGSKVYICARKKKAKIPESRSYLVRYKRTYFLNNDQSTGVAHRRFLSFNWVPISFKNYICP